jgi:aspartyl-tRNA(Asn)/glutamyl-tRNA(Gln) amidotransferase subunit A
MYRGPLHGMPIALKDLYFTRDVPTTAGSTFFQDFIPKEDAEVVSRLTAAGAVCLGKLNMHEIALGVTNVNPHCGVCRNPWDVERISGGSSGGSAVALAAGMCIGSLGSDTGGSIRIPASLCGIVGLKPTYGRVSLRGVLPLSWNLDHAGPMARRVRDVAVMLNTIAGYDPDDPNSIDRDVDDYTAGLDGGVRGWRIGLVGDDYVRQACEPPVWDALQAAADVFKNLGAQMTEITLADGLEAARANGLMTTSDAAAFHRHRLQENPEGFGEDVLRRLRKGAAYTSTEYILARRTQSLLRSTYSRLLQDYDVILLPSTPVTAPLIEGPDAVEQAAVLTRFTAPFNLTGLPAISLPCGFDHSGLPIGLQIVAAPWAEAKLLRAAAAYEQAGEWYKYKPEFLIDSNGDVD